MQVEFTDIELQQLKQFVSRGATAMIQDIEQAGNGLLAKLEPPKGEEEQDAVDQR